MTTKPPPEIEAYVRQFLPLIDKEGMNTIIVCRRPGEGAVATLTACEDLAGVLVTVVGLLRNIESICRNHAEADEVDGSNSVADFFGRVCWEMEENLDIEHRPGEGHGVDLTRPN